MSSTKTLDTQSDKDVRIDDTQPKRSRGRPKMSQGPEDASVGPEALVELTCQLLDKVPPSGVTRATIARAANVHPALIRYYFRNRDVLLRMAAQQLTQRLRQLSVRSEPGEPESAFGGLARRVANLFRFKLRHPYYHRLMLEEIATSADTETRQFFDSQNQAVRDIYRKAIEEGVADGTGRAVDPAFLYVAIVGMCEVFVTGERLLDAVGVDGKDAATQRAYEDFILDMVRRMVAR
jgi:AcrR family transcriptional regulator